MIEGRRFGSGFGINDEKLEISVAAFRAIPKTRVVSEPAGIKGAWVNIWGCVLGCERQQEAEKKEELAHSDG